MSYTNFQTLPVSSKPPAKIAGTDEFGRSFLFDPATAGGAAGVNGDVQLNIGGEFGVVDGFHLDVTGDARGANALDIQSLRLNPTQVAAGAKSLCVGAYNTAASNYGCAVGYSNSALGSQRSVAVGCNNSVATSSNALGYGNNVTGTYAMALGYRNTVPEYAGVAIGYRQYVSGAASVAIGGGCSAEGDYSQVIGNNSYATGYTSVAIGYYTTASANRSIAIGYFLTNNVEGSVDIGSTDAFKLSVLPTGDVVTRGPVQTHTMADGAAPNNALYYSSTQSALVYKDGAGVVNVLYP